MLAPRERDPGSPFALGDEPRSWGELLADAARLARGLPADAATEVMVACADRYLCAVALLAAWHSGRSAALPPNSRQETIDRLCAERGISLILHDGGGQGQLGLDVRTRLADANPGGGAPPFPLAFPPERRLVCVYTSGSTGSHVACPKTAAQLLGEAALLVRLWDLGPGTRVLATVPPHHLYGLLFGVLVPFMGGGSFVRTTPLHAETIAAQARARQANVLVSVPAHLHAVATLLPGGLVAVARIFSSGAPLDAATASAVTALAGIPVTEVLGSSETGGIAWRESGGDGTWAPFPDVHVAADEDGTMLLRSPFADAAADSGWTRGADRIHTHADGRFALLGRADGVIKIGGSRVAVAEIERLLREIPGVADAAVVPVDTPPPRRHELWAAVVAPALSVTALRAALLHRLEPIAMPRRFRLVAALPREDNGKLVKSRLLAMFEAPATPEQRTIALTVPADWHFFRGHFDYFPILAGIVQLNEIVMRELRACWPEHRHLRRVTGLKFRKPIGPGDALELELVRTPHRVGERELGSRDPVAGGSGPSQGPVLIKVAFELRRGTAVASSGTFEFLPAEPAS
ncbi:MAG TPA: AMP-binding protein [Polyangia bacterium]|jgi:acyl-coenzyme A synthetase/AMP-(fatty) acid ligase|nr:AMP-binding protein [Polyangia bacterium]